MVVAQGMRPETEVFEEDAAAVAKMLDSANAKAGKLLTSNVISQNAAVVVWCDGRRTALTDKTDKAFLIIESVDSRPADDLAKAIDVLAILAERYRGACLFAKAIATKDNPVLGSYE